jgi:hypothetical protein
MELPAGVSTSTYTYAGTGYVNPHAVTQIAHGVSTPTYSYDMLPTQVIPSAFIAPVIGSEKKIGSTRSTMSAETSRKCRLFSNGTKARRAPLSIATCNGSASERTDLMFP